MPKGSRTATPSATSFQAFFEGWLVRQEHYLDELLSAEQTCHECRDEYLRDLVNRVLSHYQQYYEEKSRIPQSDPFLVFSPPWFTSLERTFFWVAGFKPGLALRVVTDSVSDLTQEQRERIDRLKAVTRVEERMLNDEVAKIQESAGDPPVVEVARRRGSWVIEGKDAVELRKKEGDMAVEMIRSKLEAGVGSADALRKSTVVKVGEILSPAQNVTFLTAATQLQVRIRSLGLQMDAERAETSVRHPW